MTLRPATGEEAAAWELGWRDRLGPDNPRPDHRVTQATAAGVFVLEAGTETAGVFAYSLYKSGDGEDAVIDDIWIAPGHRGRGLARRGVEEAERWAREHGARALRVTVGPGTEPARRLFEGFRLTSQHMARELDDGPFELPEGVTTERIDGDAYDAWREANVAGYAQIITEAGLTTPEEAMARSNREFDTLLTDGPRTPGHEIWALKAGGEQVASIWIRLGYEPGTSYVFDVESSEAHRGKGYGKAAMRHGENRAMNAGDHRMMLNVHGHNTVALRLYEKLGYEVVREFRALDLT